MLLCDIGNTSVHFYDGKKDTKSLCEGFDFSSIDEEVFYINVHPEYESQLATLENWHDLRPFINWDKYYETMGIDRVVCCEAIEEGIIIDAGSAITVDIVKSGQFEGGFIYPGMVNMQKTFGRLSSRLDLSFNLELDLDKMPKNSTDAISYGFLRTLKSEVERHHGPIYITGGDAKALAFLFDKAQIKEHLIFDGMQKILERKC